MRRGRLVQKHPYGITDRPLEERERDLQQEFSSARARKVGNKTTRQGALKWERGKYKHRGG